MENLIKYLSNPLEYGVYHSQLIVDFKGLEKLLREIAKIVSKKRKSDARELNKIADTIKEEEYLNIDEIKEYLIKALAHYARTKECPKEIVAYIVGRNLQENDEENHIEFTRVLAHRIRRYSMVRRLRSFAIFESHTLSHINDVIIIQIEETSDDNVLHFEVTTTKEEGQLMFHDFIKNIPHIGKKVKKIRKRKTHSSRFAFRPYPLAVRLWLDHEKAITVPKDLRDFLRGSIRYQSDEEWRTSIVLSAIAVESVLADLYEEQYKKYAPNVPLGDLYHQVKGKMKFPPQIENAIEIVNEARISAVHRSRFPVSDREATNALYGSTTFIMWYSSKF